MSENKENRPVTIAATGDLHVQKGQRGKWIDFFRRVSKEAEVLVLCGDLTDNGVPEEAEILAEDLKACSIPVIAVMGNHDYENEMQDEVRRILNKDQVHVLDGDSVVVSGIGFTGLKGFGGGFDNHMLPMWGEKLNKVYVQETVNESLRLERGLVELDSKHIHGLKKIVVLHYSPAKATVKGEPQEIYPFLGCSRLAEPIDRGHVTAVFHGHAHYGTFKGKTAHGTPVYNVSRVLLEKEGFTQQYYLMKV